MTIKGDKPGKFDFKNLQEAITEKNKEKAVRFIEDLYQELEKGNSFTPSFIQDTTLELLFFVKNLVSRAIPDADRFFSKNQSFFSSILGFITLRQLCEWMKEFISETIDFLNSVSEEISPFINKLIGYIQDNYSQNIDLKLLADEFKINPVYLGQLFKKETGETFTNYLNKIRIHEAKKLLKNTNMKVNEIAIKVGYFNANYFFTIFKKFESISPVEYQRER